MKLYQVGGSVRDELMGLPHKDRDWVVVGATEEEFYSRFPGAKKVGRAFPVFLVDGEEYAFARRELKTAAGYRGFEVVADNSVTLEEDLKRRDITINAMAKDNLTGEIIDPFGGRVDIERQLLRHVSDAFAEDPLRAYRVARFAARFPLFTVAKETLALMHELKSELDSLSPERVFLEMEKALSTAAPYRFFETLRDARLLDVHFPELHKLIGVNPGVGPCHEGEADSFDHTMRVLRRVGAGDPILSFAALCHDLGKGLTEPELLPRHPKHESRGVACVETLAERLKIPNSYRAAGTMAARYHMKLPKIAEMRPSTAIALLKEIALFPGGIDSFIKLTQADGKDMHRELPVFIAKITPALSVVLPEKYWNLGKKSGEILLMLQVEKYRECVKA